MKTLCNNSQLHVIHVMIMQLHDLQFGNDVEMLYLHKRLRMVCLFDFSKFCSADYRFIASNARARPGTTEKGT